MYSPLCALLREEADGVYALSLFLDEPFLGKGYGSALIGKLLFAGAAMPDCRRFTAYVVADNIASRRVLLKNELIEREHRYFSDLPSELVIFAYTMPA